MGYLFGAVATPLTGMGDIMHSTVLVCAALVLLTQVFALMSRRIAPELSGSDIS